MPTDKLQILTPIVTSVNGQAGDVTVATKTSELTNDTFVQYTTQELTDEQKAQARNNIGAADSANVPVITIKTWTASDIT